MAWNVKDWLDEQKRLEQQKLKNASVKVSKEEALAKIKADASKPISMPRSTGDAVVYTPLPVHSKTPQEQAAVRRTATTQPAPARHEYYSQPEDIGARTQELFDRLKKNEERMADFSTRMSANNDLYKVTKKKEYADRYTQLYKNYDDAKKQYEIDLDEYNAYTAAEQQRYNNWRSTVRNSAIIQPELDAYNAKIKELKTQRENIGRELGGLGAEQSSALASQIAELQKKRDLLDEELLTSNNLYYSDFRNAEDFVANSRPNAGMETDMRYKQINDMFDTGNKERNDQLRAYYKNITKDERDMYNYLYNTRGKAAADKYIEDVRLEGILRQREGHEMFKEYDAKKGAGRFFSGAHLATSSGLQQFGKGAAQLFTEDALETTPMQYATGEAIQNASGFERIALEFAQTSANMAPSILLSSAAGNIAGMLGAGTKLATGLSKIAGAASIGGSAAGNAYAEKVQAGYDPEQARTYAKLVGASEATLSYLLSGISKLGGTVSGKVLAKNIEAIDNAFLRVGAKYAKAGISEALEEGLQEFLEPAFASWVFNEKYDAPELEDLIYTTIVSALSGGIFESGEIIGSEFERAAQNKKTTADIGKAKEMKMPAPVEQKLEETPTVSKKGTTTIENETVKETTGNAILDAAIEKTTETGKAKGSSVGAVSRDADAMRKLSEISGVNISEATDDMSQRSAIKTALEKVSEQSIPSVETSKEQVYNNTINESEELEDGVHLRESSEWNDGAYTGRQIFGVAESARRETRRNIQENARARREKAEAVINAQRGSKVSAKQLGIKNGTNNKTAYIAPDSILTQEEIREREKKGRAGIEITYVVGEMEVKENGAKVMARGAVSADGKKMWIQIDNEEVASNQIMKHEAFHRVKKKAPQLIKKLREDITSKYGEEELDDLTQAYIDAYEWGDESLDYVLEEIFADAYAGIDVFSFMDDYEGATRISEDIKSATEQYAQESGAESTGGERFSQGRRAQRGRSIELETMENNRFERLRNMRDSIPTQWYAFTKDYYYIYSNQSFMDYTILLKARITSKNKEAINKFTEGLENGTFSSSKTFNRWAQNFRRGKGRYSWYSIGTGKTGAAGRNDGVDVRKRGSRPSGNTEKGSGVSKQISESTVKLSRGITNKDSEGRILSKGQQEYFKDTKVVDENGNLKVVYHGTTNEFFVFDRQFAQIEGDFGKGYYFTSNEFDVDANYANEEGPDLKNKIARYAERLEFDDEYSELSYEEREQIAKDKFITSEPNTLEVYLNMENPVYITPDEKGTYLDFQEEYDEELDEYGEPEGLLIEFVDALYEIASEYDTFGDVDFGFLYEEAYGGGLQASDAVGIIKRRVSDELTDENGDLAVNEVIRRAFEEIGFDGIIDTSVYYKFRNMSGMDSSTTHYIVFDSNQIKLTSNENPSKNDDIRYSRGIKKEYSIKNDTEELKREIDKLNRENARLKAEMKPTKEKTVRLGDTQRAAKSLYTRYDIDGDSADIVNDLRDIGNYIVQSGGEISYDTLKKKAMKIAKGMVENAIVKNDDLYNEYSDMRKHFREKELIISQEDAANIADFKDFKRRNYGRMPKLRIAKPGERGNIDSDFRELREMWPEFFNEDETTHPADQLIAIADALDKIQPTYDNPYSYNMASATEYIANDIIDTMLSEEIRQTAPTFADKQIAKRKRDVARARAAVSEKLNKERERNLASEEKTRKEFRERENKLREKWTTRDMKRSIERHANRLTSALLRPNDKRHIPEDLRGVVATALYALNRESVYETYIDPDTGKQRRVKIGSEEWFANDTLPTKRTEEAHARRKEIAELDARSNLLKKIIAQVNGEENVKEMSFKDAITALKKQYAEMESGKKDKQQVLIAPELIPKLEELENLSDTPIGAMDKNQLGVVWEAITMIEASIENADKMFAKGRFAKVSQLASRMRDDNYNKRAPSSALAELVKSGGLELLDANRYFHMLGEAGDALFRGLRNAQDKYNLIKRDISEFSRELTKNAKVKKLEQEKQTVVLGGHERTMSTAQLMELYLLSKRPAARAHIFNGGIKIDAIPGIKKTLAQHEKAIRVTKNELNQAISKLTNEQKELADAMQKYAAETLGAYGNEASMEVFGYKKFNDPNYWSIRAEHYQDMEAKARQSKVSNLGHSKSLENNTTELYVGSVFETFARHSQAQAMYAAYLGIEQDVERVKNYSFWDAEAMDENGDVIYDADGYAKKAKNGDVQGIINRVMGKDGVNYLVNQMQDIQGLAAGEQDLFSKMTKGLIGKNKAAAVGANIRVMIQQPFAYLRNLSMMSAKYLSQVGNVKKGWEMAKKYAPIAWQKQIGYTTTKGLLFDEAGVLDTIGEWANKGAAAMDALHFGALWNACEAETKAKHKDLKVGSDEYYKVVADRYTEIVDANQVVDGVLQRPKIMRSRNALNQMATSFMSEPLKQYNMLVGAVYDVQHAQSKEAKAKALKQLAKTSGALLLSGAVNSMAQSVVDALRDDEDKEKKFAERWLDAFIGDEDAGFMRSNIGNMLNPAQYIPYARDVVSLFMGYDVTRMDTDILNKMVRAYTDLVKALSGDGKKTVEEALINATAEAARIFGIPAANLRRDIKAILMSVAVESDNYLLQYGLEKSQLNMNHNQGRGQFIDILYQAYANDKETYTVIYNDMIKSGMDAEKICSGMESRQKKAEGVKKVEDLKAQRYLPPEQEKEFNKHLSTVKSSAAYKAADKEDIDTVEDIIYQLVSKTGSYEEWMRVIEGGSKFGLTMDEWIAYKLGLKVKDQPNKKGKYGGTPTDQEKNMSLNMITRLSATEKAYLKNPSKYLPKDKE